MNIKSNLIEAHIFRLSHDRIEFLIMKRSETEIYSGIWQMVTGKIEDDEKGYQTAQREIIEETGLRPLKMWVVPNVNSFYSYETNDICLVPVFAAMVKNDVVKISDEHDEFRWVNSEEAEKMLAWAGQKKSVQIIEEYFLKKNEIFHFVEIPTELLR